MADMEDDTQPLDDGQAEYDPQEDYVRGEGANLSIWHKIDTTDPRFTKKQDTGARLTSINGQYQIMRMTEAFGPCGLNWGYEILSSEFIDTGPIINPDMKDINGVPIVIGNGKLHTMRVQLWYLSPEDRDNKAAISGIGHTPFMYRATNNGQMYVRVDDEYEKKSLTDALTNAMSKLGMAADVRMGMYDKTDYVQGLRDDIAIQEAGDSAAEAAEQRHQFEDWWETHMGLIKTAASIRELEKIFVGGQDRVKRQGTPELVKEHKEAKDLRFRELMPKKEKASG